MAFFYIGLAGLTISVNAIYDSTALYCKKYLSEKTPDFDIVIQDSDLDYERQKSAQSDESEGVPIRSFSDEYLETLAVYRKIAERMPRYDTVLFHGSVVAVDGVGYLFTAKSGTGKSTHTRLWREAFGKRAQMINDDKPLLKITSDEVFAYGTPWDGKHHLSTNTSVPLKAICILHRDKENHIERISKKEAYSMLLQQVYRPADSNMMLKTLQLLDRLGDRIALYSLGCNMELDAARVSYGGMNERSEEL